MSRVYSVGTMGGAVSVRADDAETSDGELVFYKLEADGYLRLVAAWAAGHWSTFHEDTDRDS